MIRGQKTPIIPEERVEIETNIHNRFDIEVIDAKTKKLKQKAVAYNCICDHLWNSLGKENEYFQGYFKGIAFGKGEGVPSSGDKKLFNALGAKSVLYKKMKVKVDYKKGIMSLTAKIELLSDEYIDETITEVGIVSDTNNNGDNFLCTHAMLKDMNGNKISIKKSDTDIINIYATMFLHFNPNQYDNGHVILYPSFNSYQLGDEQKFNGFGCWILGLGKDYKPYYCFFKKHNFFWPKGEGSNPKDYKASNIKFNKETKKVEIKISRIEASELNNKNGFGKIQISSNPRDSRYLDKEAISGGISLLVGGSWYPKSSIINEAVGTGDGQTKDFKTKFNYPENAKIYVNGVLNENVQVENKIVSTETDDYIEFEVFDREMNKIYVPILSEYSNYGLNSSLRIITNPIWENCVIIITNHLFPGCTYTLRKNENYEFYGSNDKQSWELIDNNAEQFKHIRIGDGNVEYDKKIHVMAKITNNYNPLNIHFDTPPEPGTVITADYDTKTIAKDKNHVFDLKIEISLGEMQGA